MGFTKTKAKSVLESVFKPGNKIALLTAVNTAADTYTEASGKGYERYTIQSGDFVTNYGENGGAESTTAQHILFGLAEESWGTIVGIAVFGSGLDYLAELKESKTVGADTVPVFKAYDKSKEEGIKVTLDVSTSASASVTETT